MLILTVLLFFIFLVLFCVPGEDPEGPKIPGAQTPEEKKEAEKNKKKKEEEGTFVKDKDEQVTQIRFNKQCYLVDQIETIMRAGAEKRKKGYKRFSTITAPPMDVTNELVSKKGITPLLQIKEHQLALLQPRIRLYITQYPKGKKGKPVDIQLPFDSALGVGSSKTDLDKMFETGNFRGSGAGIKSFSYDLAGVNPAEADKLIDATLVLFFQSIGDLFEPRAGEPGNRVGFSDLINYTQRIGQKKGKPNNNEIDPKDFRIKAVVGWSEPEVASAFKAGLLPKALSKALIESKVTLFLQLVDHTITFNQNGNLELEIKYVAALDQTLRSASLDIFWIPEDVIVASYKQALKGGGLERAIARQEKLQSAKLRLATAQAAQQSGVQAETAEEILQDTMGGAEYRTYNQAFAGAPEGLSYDDALALLDKQENAKMGAGKLAGAVVGVGGALLSGGASTALGSYIAGDGFKGTKAEIEAASERLKEVGEDLDKLKRKRRTMIYRRMLDGIFGTDGAEGRLYVVKVSACEAGIFSQDLGVASGQLALRLREKCQAASGNTGAKVRDAGADAAKTRKDGLNQIAATAVEEGKPSSSQISNFNDINAQELGNAAEAGEIPIHFFYLGDFIDVLLEILVGEVQLHETEKPDSRKKINGKPNPELGKYPRNTRAIESLEEFNILIGPIVLNDKKNKRRIVGNIAEIPISLDLFSQWFVEKVIKTQRPSYYFKDIMQDIITDLVSPALGAGCLNEEIQKGKISSIPLTVPALGNAQSRIPKYGARCSLSDLRGNKAGKMKTERASTGIHKLTNYLYWFMTDENVNHRAVDVKKDQEDGIYHLRIGSDAGLVKEVQFQQTDIPGLKESYITNEASHKDGFLRAKYDSTIRMLGNVLFRPGQYVYVHPSVPGSIGTEQVLIRDNLQKIGLGGYYLVHKVFHIISDEYYQTELSAVHESHGVFKSSPAVPFKPVTIGGSNRCTGKNKAGDPAVYGAYDSAAATEDAATRAEAEDHADNFTAIGLAANLAADNLDPGFAQRSAARVVEGNREADAVLGGRTSHTAGESLGKIAEIAEEQVRDANATLRRVTGDNPLLSYGAAYDFFAEALSDDSESEE